MVLLLKSAVRLADGYFAILGLNFVDSNKHTISSLAFLASQTRLMRDARVGMFNVRNELAYAILKSGTRGGLTSVLRTSCGSEAEGSGDPIHRCNSHLRLGDDEVPRPADYGISLDVGSLYGHCCEYGGGATSAGGLGLWGASRARAPLIVWGGGGPGRPAPLYGG